MKFKRGDNVEVLKRTKEQYDSWFPGKIISVEGSQYIVRYDLFVNLEGEPKVEKVHQYDVRPQPLRLKEEERWVSGDVAEVFHLHCWRPGKVVKVLKDSKFGVRLLGTIQLREYHGSSLRICRSWKNNKWVMIEKVGIDQENGNGMMCLDSGNPEPGIPRKTYPKEKDGQNYLKNAHVKTLKRKHGFHFKSSLNNADMKFGLGKRQRTTKLGECEELAMRALPFSKQVDGLSPKADPHANTGKWQRIGCSMMDSHPLSFPIEISEETKECSVASCSSNKYPDYTLHNSKKPPTSRDVAGSPINDAESCCPSVCWRKHLPSSTEDELEASIHNLELVAYKRTLQALYASGPLSWEQESLLTNLRLSLHISNEEHLIHLKQLLSLQVA